MANSAGGKDQGTHASTSWRLIAVLALVVAGGVGLLIYVAAGMDARSAGANAEADRWQAAYWKKPIPAQGKPPEDFLEQARGIHPKDCGQCHAAQYGDWGKSIHGKAMGPGVAGQFPGMDFAGQAQCLECHAPMSEQWAGLRGAGGKWKANPAFDTELQSKGMVCGACHLRGHRRHGPPLAKGRVSASQLAHGDPVRTEFFRASEFCKGCHQHSTATSMVINGKTVENTYREWLESPYPGRGITCQKCHMPGGRHLWKGIHDREMTRSGVTISATVSSEQPAAGEEIEAVLTLSNTGTGHAFPTYTTPAVFLRAALLDEDGEVVPGDYFEEKILQRRLDMSTSPWGERFDTRVLPGESASLAFSRTVPEQAASLYMWVWVEPDHFYTGFYRYYADSGKDFPGAEQLSRALRNSLESRYLLFSRTVPIRFPDGKSSGPTGREARQGPRN